MKRPIVVDLFAGAGGLSLGFEEAGFEVLAAVEIDPINCKTHEFNFPNCAVICQDIQTVTGKQIRTQSAIAESEIDVVVGGSPCQGFSFQGNRQFNDPRNLLIKEFVRLVDELQPKVFLLENVKGILAGKHKQHLDRAIANLKTSGYEIVLPYKILNAVNYGVPQHRERLFLIGCRRGLTLPQYPQPMTRKPLSKSLLNLPSCPTVWDAIGDLPECEDYNELWEQDWVVAEDEYGKPSSYAAILRGVDDFGLFSYPPHYDPRLLTCSLRTNHSKIVRDRFQKTKPGTVESISHFLKLDPHGISNTLRAGTRESGHTAPRPIHPYTPRCITVREAARLHSYPDWFKFHPTKWHGFRQIGNSVPPLLGRTVASEIIKILS